MGALQQILIAGGGGGGGGYSAETLAWEAGIIAAGSSVTTQEKDWADALAVAIMGASYASKIIWLNPFLGSTIIAARMPLIDRLAAGIMNSYGSSPFVDADCGNAVGIQNPTEKNAYLGMNIGINWNAANGYKAGFWFSERNWGNGANTEPMGAYDAAGANRFVLDFRNTFRRGRYGGTTQSEAGPATSMANGDYYFQYDGSSTQLYKDGPTDGAANTIGPFAGGASDVNELFVMGVNGPSDLPWDGRCGVAGLLDGTMSGADIADFRSKIVTYLFTPTGR